MIAFSWATSGDVVGGSRAGGCSWRRISPPFGQVPQRRGNELRRGGGARNIDIGDTGQIAQRVDRLVVTVAAGAAVFSGGRFHERRYAVALMLGMGVGTGSAAPSRRTTLFLLGCRSGVLRYLIRRHRPGDVPTMVSACWRRCFARSNHPQAV